MGYTLSLVDSLNMLQWKIGFQDVVKAMTVAQTIASDDNYSSMTIHLVELSTGRLLQQWRLK